MDIKIRKITSIKQIQPKSKNTAYLLVDNWDDHSFKTQFFLTVFDGDGKEHDIGSLKIGYVGQTKGWTEHKILPEQNSLLPGYFSIGLDVDYYKKLTELLPSGLSGSLLGALRDVADNEDAFATAENEDVFKVSLLRDVSLSVIIHQYRRVLGGHSVLTNFDFSYSSNTDDTPSGFNLTFNVAPDSKPPSNLHVLIGKNGVGKTTLLNNMIKSITTPTPKKLSHGFSEVLENKKSSTPISKDYFSSLTSVSFSAFDPFSPEEKPDRSTGTGYFYIGLKKTTETGHEIKTAEHLNEDFQNSLKSCFSTENKKQRWVRAIKILESDVIFADMQLTHLTQKTSEALDKAAEKLYSKMSSGHRIILLTMTKLVETIEEKTLILIDEPESHLHPPLLSAFTRALCELLIDRNAVAIVATHSPVVLQEVPSSCVWILRRTNQQISAERPERETFGENVGVLTDEVFGLEVSESGFLKLLKKSVNKGHSYKKILKKYDNKLGFEGRSILRALVANKKTQKKSK